MPQQHERDENLAQAEAKLAMAISEVSREHGLTTAECCLALSVVLSRWAQYEVRDERLSKSER